MSINIDSLVASLQSHAPIGVEVPRLVDSNDIDEDTITRWAEDAAQTINERRGKTTLKEVVLTMVADTTEYDLPSDCREVKRIVRRHATVQSSTILGIPSQGINLGMGPYGTLPTGQEVTPSIDAINRGRLVNTAREDEFELIGGQIRMLFPIEAGEEIKVRYTAVDRSFENLSDDRYTMILDYILIQNLDWFFGVHGTGLAQDGDSFGQTQTSVLFRRKRDLEERWLAALNSIGPEAN